MFLFTRGTRLFGLALLTFSAVGCVDNASAPVGSQGLVVAVETLSLGSLLEGPDAELRSRLAAALVGGLLYSLWVVGDEELIAAGRAELVRRYGALLQELITP